MEYDRTRFQVCTTNFVSHCAVGVLKNISHILYYNIQNKKYKLNGGLPLSPFFHCIFFTGFYVITRKVIWCISCELSRRNTLLYFYFFFFVKSKVCRKKNTFVRKSYTTRMDNERKKVLYRIGKECFEVVNTWAKLWYRIPGVADLWSFYLWHRYPYLWRGGAKKAQRRKRKNIRRRI